MREFLEKTSENSEVCVVDNLISQRKKKEEKDKFGDWLIYEISYGNKHLEIRLNKNNNNAHTFIRKIDNPEIKNQTTIIYKSARKILEKISNETEKNVEYKFMTENKKMAEWANMKGREIFEWEDEIVQDGGKGNELFVFSKKFVPKNNN